MNRKQIHHSHTYIFFIHYYSEMMVLHFTKKITSLFWGYFSLFIWLIDHLII
jgi:hypothetical protein